MNKGHDKPGDQSPTSGDPRLEIPEILRRPVEQPASLKKSREESASSEKNDEAVQMASGWVIGLNFVYAILGMALLGWAAQAWLVPQWKPWPVVAGLLIGLIGGFVRFVREALAAASRDLTPKNGSDQGRRP